MFTDEPGMEVGIRCLRPDLLELVDTTVAGNTTATSVDATINYTGSVETGIIFTMTVNRALTDFTIYHTPPDGIVRSLYFSNPLANGDKIVISTVPGSKYARLTLSGSTSYTSILRGVSPSSNWIEFQPGPNKFRVSATGAAIAWSLSYTNRHGAL
jgi:hypothetical protein